MRGKNAVVVKEIERKKIKMPERKEEDMEELIPVPTKPLIPAIPVDDDELKDLGEDLRAMGCAGLLAVEVTFNPQP